MLVFQGMGRELFGYNIVTEVKSDEAKSYRSARLFMALTVKFRFIQKILGSLWQALGRDLM